MSIYEEVRQGAAYPASHTEDEDGPILVMGGAGSGKGVWCSPQHRVNPLDCVASDSPSLIDGAQKIAPDCCPAPGGVKNAWFSDHARRWVFDQILHDAEQHGVASLSSLYSRCNL